MQAPLIEHPQYHSDKDSSKCTEEAEEKIFFSGRKYTRTKCGRKSLGGWKHVAHQFENILPQITYNEIQATLKVLEVFVFFYILSSS